jgi:hypothetical protein
MDKEIENIFKRLQGSRFRAGIKLSLADQRYYKERGSEVIRGHAEGFIAARLAPARPKNDRRQTPWRGHPVFTAQHATATCCRSCLYKWHRIERVRALSQPEIDHIVRIIMHWLDQAISRS